MASVLAAIFNFSFVSMHRAALVLSTVLWLVFIAQITTSLSAVMALVSCLTLPILYTGTPIPAEKK